MPFLDEVDMAFLAIGRSINCLSSEQIHHHKEVLSKLITAQDEEDEPYVIGDDDDVNCLNMKIFGIGKQEK